LGDLIIIIRRNGAKTISLQTLFGRLNYWKNPEKTARYDRIINEWGSKYNDKKLTPGSKYHKDKLNPGSKYHR
jgi:hypothetical protein